MTQCADSTLQGFLPNCPNAAGCSPLPMVSASHPFALQFKYRSCSDESINAFRRTAKAAKIIRVLNTVCRSAIAARSRYVQHSWGVWPVEEFNCRFIQEGYGYQGFSPELKEFSIPDGMSRIKLLPATAYYDRDFSSGDYELALPESIEQYLDKVFSLTGKQARQFDIASTWFSQVESLWPRSSSSVLMAVVSAIEALLDKKQERCEACGQPKFGITKQFRAFLKEHVPAVEQRFPEEYKALYKVRSHLAHGVDLLVADLEYWNSFGTPLRQWRDDLQRNTHYITGTALRNWVLTR